MKIYVRHGDGELMFPSFRDFQSMYRMNFVGPDDLVRRETSSRWVRAGDLPELRSSHLYERRNSRRISGVFWLMLAACALVVLVQLFFRLG